MKFTIKLDNGETTVFEGERAEKTMTAIITLYDDYIKREQQANEAFDELLAVLRK